MEESSVKSGAIKTAKVARSIMVFLGSVMILGPVVFHLLVTSGSQTKLTLEVILAVVKGYFLPGLMLIVVGEYMYYLLVTQAFIAYNSRRMTDSCDVIESGVHRMAGLGYGQNVRPAEPVNPQPVNMQDMNPHRFNM